MADSVIVSQLPLCDFADSRCTAPAAEYDFKTQMGPWANACGYHWERYRASSKLGTGHGQRLVLRISE